MTTNTNSIIDRVQYDSLDAAKAAFIAASRQTLQYAEQFGFVPNEQLGASANVFSLNLQPFLKAQQDQLYITLLPEGLGTADDARPADLTADELVRFWRNIALKTVSVLTNDAASSGLQTILISLYLPSSQPEVVFTPQFMEGFLGGFVAGCKTVGCVYFSGETPQLKDKLVDGKLDVAGALFGLLPVGRQPISSQALQPGHQIVFIESTGPHENGFTTLRSLATNLPQGYRTTLPSGQQYWEAINQPAHLYTPLIQDIMAAGVQPSNIEPITGHGWQKLMRPQQSFRYVIEQTLPIPEIFSFVEQTSQLDQKTMLQTFNYGTGLAIYVPTEADAATVIRLAEQRQWKAVLAGHVESSPKREVVVKPWNIMLSGEEFNLRK